jgi:hypothetical protein
MYATDQMDQVYEAFVHWADVILVPPIRRGNASSLYYKMFERCNFIQNPETIAVRVLLKNKVAAFIITGGQDNVQGVAGQMLTLLKSGVSFSNIPSSPIRPAGRPKTWKTISVTSKKAPNSGMARAGWPGAVSIWPNCSYRAITPRLNWLGAGERPTSFNSRIHPLSEVGVAALCCNAIGGMLTTRRRALSLSAQR